MTYSASGGDDGQWGDELSVGNAAAAGQSRDDRYACKGYLTKQQPEVGVHAHT